MCFVEGIVAVAYLANEIYRTVKWTADAADARIVRGADSG